jgi:hypothetical protein
MFKSLPCVGDMDVLESTAWPWWTLSVVGEPQMQVWVT